MSDWLSDDVRRVLTLLIAQPRGERCAWIDRSASGPSLRVGDTDLMERGEVKSFDRYHKTLHELQRLGLVAAGPGGQFYELTESGEKAAQRLDPGNDKPKKKGGERR